MTSFFRVHVRLAGCALAALALVGFQAVPPAGAAAEYGPLHDGVYEYFTRIGADGSTAWRKAASAALHDRGFSDAQIGKVTRLRLNPITKGMPGDYTPGRAGTVKFSAFQLPLRFNSETGTPLPVDPRAFAAALPDCYAKDERACTLRFSAQEENTSASGDGSGPKSPCMLPERTVQFCRSHGFVNRNTFHSKLPNKDFSPSCGEQDRINGCGADEVVFDDGEEQTKLVFDIGQAEKNAPAEAAASAAQPAAPPKPVVFPRIVYHGDKDTAFTRRDGPATPEEWEPDLNAFKQLRQAERKQAPNLSTLQAAFDKRKTKWIAYCWPHDVFKPCDIE